MSPVDIIGWTVAIGFPVTFVLAVLGLVKKKFIPAPYVKALFGAVILELITAAFWLLQEDFKVAFEPRIEGQNIVLFSADGEPLPKTDLKLGDDVVKTFNGNLENGFDVERELKNEQGAIQVLVKNQDFTLGKIKPQNLSSRVTNSILSPEQHFDLGAYYSQFTGEPRARRDPLRAINHLRAVLMAEEHRSDHSSAAQQLFHLKESLQSCQDFELLAHATEKHTLPPNRFKEMGDIYLAMSLYLRSFDPESRKAAKGFALWNFVFFLTLPDAREGSPPHSQARRRIQEIAVVFREGHSVRVAIEQGTDQALIGALHLLPNSFGCPDAGSQVAEIPIEGASLAGVAALTMPSP